jgi:hypothetical protein
LRSDELKIAGYGRHCTTWRARLGVGLGKREWGRWLDLPHSVTLFPPRPGGHHLERGQKRFKEATAHYSTASDLYWQEKHMSARSCHTAADLNGDGLDNGDGRIDPVCIDSTTSNLKRYENKGRKK